LAAGGQLIASLSLLKTPRADGEKHLERMALHRISEAAVRHLESASLPNHHLAISDIETDWHRGVAYVGMSCAHTRLHVIIHEDCDGKRREREPTGPAVSPGPSRQTYTGFLSTNPRK